jgi:beta-carotene hydroxylase
MPFAQLVALVSGVGVVNVNRAGGVADGQVRCERAEATIARGGPDPGITVPKIAVPTVLVWLCSVAVWAAATAVVLSDASRWWLAVTIPVQALATFAVFTVLHESVHHTVSRLDWVNQLFGRLSLPFVSLIGTFPIFSYIHFEHHRHTNEDIHADPDAWSHAGPRWQLPLRWMTIDAWYGRCYLPRIRRAPPKEVTGFVTNLAVVIALVGALIGVGYGLELVLIHLIPQRLGLVILALLFNWLPHHDLGGTPRTDRFQTSRVRVGWERVMNPLLLYQNYHLVHHIHPMIPFYLLVKEWKNTEIDYLDRNVPINTVWGRELTPSEYRAWRQTPSWYAAERTDREQLFVSTNQTEFANDAGVVPSTVTVTLDNATTQMTTAGDESLLEAALRTGIDAPYSCTGGACGTCKAKLLLGTVHMEQNYTLNEDDVADGWILTCQSRPTTDVIHVDYDRLHRLQTSATVKTADQS